VCALAAGPAIAAPGDLDPSFAGTGLVAQQLGDNTGDGDFAFGVAAQPDGKTVVVGVASNTGQVAGGVVRYLVDGTPDPSFGTGGKVIDTAFVPQAVALQPDGKIVAVGAAQSGANSTYAFVRYLPNGNLDPSFGAGTGKVSMLVNPTDNQQRAQAIAIQPDGKIVAAGRTNDGAGIVRLNSDGTPDPGFDGDGSHDFPIATTVSGATDVAVQSDGSVVAAVPTGSGLGDGFTLIRVDGHGAPDTSFGPGGVLHVASAVSDGAESRAVAIQPDGKIVAGGTAEVGSHEDQFAVARFNSNGMPDTSFSGGGLDLSPVAPAGQNASGKALVIQPNGKILLAGQADLDTNRRTLAYVRYNPSDGSLDPSFGSGGVALSPFPAGWGRQSLNDAALACDGKIVSAGEATITPTAHGSFLTSRIFGDPIACPGLNPPPPGAVVDRTKPRSKIHRLPRVIRSSKLKKFLGTASDNAGIAKVEIALLRRVGKTAAFSRHKAKASCLWLRSSRAKFKRLKPRRGKCAKATFLRAKGTSSWVFKLRKRLPPGKYVLYARATDMSGNAETSFSTKQGNRIAFQVRKG
jgi:uncharacterized delta-60 repeat protein